MIEEIKFDKEARELIKQGVDTLANAVKVTLGAKGRNVMIGLNGQKPYLTKDGVTVANTIELEDVYANQGAQMVKEVAARTNADAGDGTTTATVLAQAIIDAGILALDDKVNPVGVKRGIDIAVDGIIKNLKVQAKDVSSIEMTQQIATISANGDAEIGKLIANVIKEVTKDGIVTIDEAVGTETTVEAVKGLRIDRGFMSPYFAEDRDKMETVLYNPFILLVNEKITTTRELDTIMQYVKEQGRDLLLVVDALDDDVLSSIVAVVLQKHLRVAVIKSPEFGDARKDILEDMSTLLDTIVISPEKGISLDNVTSDVYGTAEKVIITKDHTTFINSIDAKGRIENRVARLRRQMKDIKEDYKLSVYKERIAKLSGGVGVIYVGGTTEIEMREKKDRIEDALNATKAALEEGVVPGGGLALMIAVENILTTDDMNADEKLGMQIIRKAVFAPFKQIIINAGLDPEDVIREIAIKSLTVGYNVTTDKYEDFFETGIIDPVKVTRNALENAASIAGMFLTTECIIVEKKQE